MVLAYRALPLLRKAAPSMSTDGDIVREALETDDASFGHPDAITAEALAALARLEAAAASAYSVARLFDTAEAGLG